MKGIIFALIFAIILLASQCNTKDQIICPGNRFIFLSTYVLGLQQDLTQAFAAINSSISIEQVVYKEQIFRTYKIFNVKHNLIYQQGKQYAQLASPNVLMITGGNVKIQFSFQWQKIQLGSTLSGTGFGFVSSDVITYQKTLYTNETHEIMWNLTKVQSFSVTNGISLKTIQPYRASDYQILSNMLNKLKTNQTTIKDHFLTSINEIYKPVLTQKVRQNEAYHYQKITPYIYRDYRGNFSFSFKNTLMNSTLTERGLYLLFSQVTIGDQQFQCGAVPNTPDDVKYGGLQQFISNNLIKSCLRYTIKKGSLDVVLNQQFWQSRAFQFFMGDLHQVMPSSTKKIQSLQQIKGKCVGLDDPVFTVSRKNDKSYQAKVNFACNLNFNNSNLISINIVANYEIQPNLAAKKIDFILTGIAGTPQFIQTQPFEIEYPELAQFMVTQTLALAKGGNVIGSGFKALNRKYPRSLVRQNYLFLYDSSLQSGNIFQKKQTYTI